MKRFKARWVPAKDILAVLERNDQLQQRTYEPIGIYLDRIHACSVELNEAMYPDDQHDEAPTLQAICNTAVLASYNGMQDTIKTKFVDMFCTRKMEQLTWPEYAKLVKEAGLVTQKAGKLMQSNKPSKRNIAYTLGFSNCIGPT